MYARCTVASQVGNPSYFFLMARMSGSDGNLNAYGVQVRYGNAEARLFSLVNGVFAALDTVAYTYAADDVWEIRCNGTAISGLLNSTEVLSVTSSDITTGQFAGVAASVSTNDSVSLSVFKAGTLTSGTPDETATEDPLPVVEWTWPGIPTTSEITVSCYTRNVTNVRLVVDTTSDLATPVFTGSWTAVDSNGIVKLTATGLSADTAYHYGVEWDDGTTTGFSTDRNGIFTTAPSGAASFEFTVSGDHSTITNANEYLDVWKTSNAPTFDRIVDRAPAFHYISGDVHYRNPSANDQDFFRWAYRDILSGNPKGSDFHRAVPSSYVWDDHDYSDQDPSTGSATSQPAATAVYRQAVPHPTLGVDSVSTDPIGHSWTWGRVRFVALDHRSSADRTASPRTALGTAQKSWLTTLLGSATEPLIVLFVGFPWISTEGISNDDWGGFPDERAELAEFFETNSLTSKLLIVHADSHMLAIDDGTNSQYDTGSVDPGPPVFCCAPLDSTTSFKGGPYSEGFIPNPVGSVEQQYGAIEVTDTGGSSITVDLRGFQLSTDGLTETQVISYQFVVSATAGGTAHTRTVTSTATSTLVDA